MLQSLCLMPQIIRNLKGPGNPGFYYSYIIGFLTMHRYIFPVYEHGCPQNLFRYHPDNGFVIGWSILYLVQVAVSLFRFCFSGYNTGRVLDSSYRKDASLAIMSTIINTLSILTTLGTAQYVCFRSTSILRHQSKPTNSTPPRQILNRYWWRTTWLGHPVSTCTTGIVFGAGSK